MKKTFTINISGTVFHIDEDAYDLLKNYLSKVSAHFKNEEGGHEIINDIEARIAELFTQKTTFNQDVITDEMVKEIIAIMGLPEDFTDSEDTSGTKEKTSYNTQGSPSTKTKRLYRDTESRVIGGVCSGLAHYLKMDKVLVRILFFILIIVTSGTGFLAYLILWIAVPKARTTSQKLEMKGEEINVDSIGKSVKEEFSEMKENFDKFKDSKEFEKGKEYARKAGQSAQNAGRGAASVISKVFGALLLCFGFISLVGIIFGLFGATKIIGLYPEFISGEHSGLFVNHIFSSSMATTLLIAVFIIIGIPFLLLVYAGTKMLFNYYSNSLSIVLSALGVWLIAVIVAVGSTFGAIDVFSSQATATDKIELTTLSDTIFIKLDTEKFADLTETKFEFNNVLVMEKGNDEILVARPKFTIEPNSEKNTALKIKKTSRGNNYKQAKGNAENIKFQYSQNGNTLVLDPYFTIEENGKWRSQDVKITLQIPEGKVVYLNDNLLPIIHNIKNTNNTWDGDMTNNYWKMQPEGLTLIQLSK